MLAWFKTSRREALLVTAWVLPIFRTVECSVDAEWLQVGKSWVRLYELTEITAKHRNSAIHLDFKDSAGREVQVQADDLQKSREMWYFVYNGILHSVIAGGAKTKGLLHSSFRVPRPEKRSE